jgi:hypothetical protein
MGRILALNPPFNGMSAIVNVAGRVGPREQNNPDDVRVVQRLLQMCSRGQAFSTSAGVAQVTGHFDAVTGFWIFNVQERIRATMVPSQIVDGIVSPAHGARYGGGIWTIVMLNSVAKANSPGDYSTYLAQSAT